MDYDYVVNNYINKKYGKENIKKKSKAKNIGLLGATEFTLNSGETKVAYFHYQLEEVCIVGEPWW